MSGKKSKKSKNKIPSPAEVLGEWDCLPVEPMMEGLDKGVTKMVNEEGRNQAKIRAIRNFAGGVLRIIDEKSAKTSEIEPDHLGEICDEVDGLLDGLKKGLKSKASAQSVEALYSEVSHKVLDALYGRDEISRPNPVELINEIPEISKERCAEMGRSISELRMSVFMMSVKRFAARIGVREEKLAKMELGKLTREDVQQVVLNTGVNFGYLLGEEKDFSFSPFRPASQRVVDVLNGFGIEESAGRERFYRIVAAIGMDFDGLSEEERAVAEEGGIDLKFLAKAIETI